MLLPAGHSNKPSLGSILPSIVVSDVIKLGFQSYYQVWAELECCILIGFSLRKIPVTPKRLTPDRPGTEQTITLPPLDKNRSIWSRYKVVLAV